MQRHLDHDGHKQRQAERVARVAPGLQVGGGRLRQLVALGGTPDVYVPAAGLVLRALAPTVGLQLIELAVRLVEGLVMRALGPGGVASTIMIGAYERIGRPLNSRPPASSPTFSHAARNICSSATGKRRTTVLLGVDTSSIFRGSTTARRLVR
jgi:hypothetical protein